MSTQIKNHRKHRRIHQTQTLYPLSFRIQVGKKSYEMEAINYHLSGACLRFYENPSSLESFKSSHLLLHIFLGKKELETNIPFEIIWESLSETKCMGIRFLKKINPFVFRPARYFAHRHFYPIINVCDPLEPNRKIYFKVIDLSEQGMRVLSSLSNRHILPGIVLKKAAIAFPNGSQATITLKVRHVRTETEEYGCFHIGMQIVETTPDFVEKLRDYISIFAPTSNTSQRVQILKKDAKLSRKLKHGLSFCIINSTQEYQKLLNLRLEGFSMVGRTPKGAKAKDLGSGLENEATLFAAYLNGQMVASMELNFGDKTSLRILPKLPKTVRERVPEGRVVEVGKLVIHPSAHGTDIMVGLIQRIHSTLVLHGGYHVLLVTVKELIPLYKRIGCRNLRHHIPHPHVPGLNLSTMVMPKKVYLSARCINAYNWSVVFTETQRFMESVGLTEKLKFNPWQHMQFGIGSVAHKILKFQKKTRKKKKAA